MRLASTETTGRDERKKISQGVDGREIGCMMCGSLGHFGAEGKGRGAEAGSDDL